MFKTQILRSAVRRGDRFQFPEDTYVAWALLAASEGAFAYDLVGLESGEARPGEVVFCPPGVLLRRRALTPVFVFHFIEFDPEEIMPSAGKLSVLDVARLNTIFSEFHRLAESRDEECQRWLPHLLQDIIYRCDNGCRQNPPRLPSPDRLMEQAQRLLEERWQEEDLSLADVAKFLGLSAVQFTRRFRTAHGRTPSACLMALRLEHAHRLIAGTELPLSEIAAQCGYRDAFYLSRVFKAVYGAAPAYYRRRYRV